MIKKLIAFAAIMFVAFSVMAISGYVTLLVLVDPIITARGVMDGQ